MRKPQDDRLPWYGRLLLALAFISSFGSIIGHVALTLGWIR